MALLPVAAALLHNGHDDVLGGHEGQLGLDPPLDDLRVIMKTIIICDHFLLQIQCFWVIVTNVKKLFLFQ